MKSPHDFNRTTCACERCTACCKRQPGALIPDDYERIQKHLGASDAEMESLFWASPGSLCKTRDGRVVRIGSITPRYDRRKKSCVFLDENNRCKIHAVAPFGCSHFDTHMSDDEGQARSSFMAYAMTEAEYQNLRERLPYASHYKPTRY